VSKYSFRMRSTSRNHDTDEVRFGRLTNLLDQMSAEITTERAGLAGRYRDVVANAAFLMERTENGEDAAAKLADLTATIRTFEARMANLASQRTFVGQLRTAVDDFRARAAETANTALAAAVQHKRASGAGR
jgi:hypothetical protein